MATSEPDVAVAPAGAGRRLRIGYLYPFRAYPPKGGNHLHAWQLIRGFLARGHAVATLGDDSVPGVTSFPATPAGVASLLAASDVLYVRLDGNFVGAWPLAVQAIEQARVPVVWEINAAADERLAFSWLGGNRPVPSGALGRVFDRARRRLHATRQLPRISAEERLRQRLATRVSAALCVSSAVGRYAASTLRIPLVRVVPNGSDPGLMHPDREPVQLPDRFADHLKVLYAGSPIYPWQGFDVICRAVALQQRVPAKLAFIFLVNQAADTIPVADNVLVFPSVPYDDVARYITAADVCISIHPDQPWSPWGFHGSPTKLFDYMACGRTVLASRVGQLAEVIEDGVNGVLCDYTPEDLLDRLDYLARRPDQRRIMGRNARQAVLERYNWDSAARATLDVFQQVTCAV